MRTTSTRSASSTPRHRRRSPTAHDRVVWRLSSAADKTSVFYVVRVDLSVDEARRRATAARVAHLATADGNATPHIVPVTFAVAGDTVFMAVDQKPKRTRELKRLQNIRTNRRVSFLVDQYDDEDWSRLWWVRADGEASIITGDEISATNALALLVEKYRQYVDAPPAGPFVGLAVQRWRGWQYAGA